MPKSRKPELYNRLKATGAPLSTSYMKYTSDELERELTALGVDFSDVLIPEHVVTKTEEAVPPFSWRSLPFIGSLLPNR